MSIPVNTFKRGILQGQVQIGLWSQLGNPISVEMIAGSGVDWIGLDAEHGPSELVDVYYQLQACAAGGNAHPVVRVPWNDRVLIKQYLDIGAQTLVVPQVETAGQAREVVWATRYTPRGGRGYCGAPRASKFGRVKDYPFVYEQELCVLIQPETAVALKNLEEMAAVDGIDGFFFGPGDLAADLGYLHQATHADVVKELVSGAKRVRAAGKAAGIICMNEALTRQYIEAGFNIVAVGSDQSILTRGADELAVKFKGASNK
ncbi:MAG: HpcH/HpaI aldolase/citrate lyase family protein [Candidatus Accumulibacter sp.]|nr:HpcH/HpaI aldolase/citrate lyase family protein [Accumulibacter sp.]